MSLNLFDKNLKDPENRDYMLRALLSISGDPGQLIEVVFNEIGVPADRRSTILDALKKKRYISINGGLRPTATISKEGLKYIDEMQEDLLQNNKPVPGMNIIEMPLNETRELIFRMHKDNNSMLTWTKQTFDKDAIPKDWTTAKTQMIQSGVIFQVPNSRIPRTALNELVGQCNNYAEALALIESRSSQATTQYNFNVGDITGSNIAFQSSSNSQSVNPRKQNPTQIEKHITKNATIKEVLIGVLVAVIGGLILWYLTNKLLGG